MRYTIAQPKRLWSIEGTRLFSDDGAFEITQDPVYGYFRLTRQDDPFESIAEHATQHALVLHADTLEPLPN